MFPTPGSTRAKYVNYETPRPMEVIEADIKALERQVRIHPQTTFSASGIQCSRRQHHLYSRDDVVIVDR